MVARWLILADDLTGAADCAIAFRRRGSAAAVIWGEAAPDRRIPILSYDADSRGLGAEAAARRHTALLERLHTADRRLFKKIDSTVRGQPAAESAATLAHVRARSGRAFGVLAPAFPGTGRTTVDGRIRVGGRPLEEAEVWRRDHTYASADLGAVLASAGIRSWTLTLPAVRGGNLAGAMAEIAAGGDGIVVCDAETDDDLRRIADAGLAATPSAFFIGSAGLAHALAAARPAAALDPVRIAPVGRGSLIVVGSLAGVSRASARRLLAGGAVAHLPVKIETLLADGGGLADLALRLAQRLATGEDALVEIMVERQPDMSLGPRLAHALADALAPIAGHIGALAATGGETAAALLKRFGVHGIQVADEIEPGVSLGLTLGRISIPIATKAGAFGDADSLARIRDRLHRARTEGSLT
ncbi:four-carbon acid sugar kinase family protein [Methylobacterium sp. NEAU K]|uniref:four-carbon acid sugar kinase family protein n=1 Tax=Methylobacterium sp. NEAU K TaxID=3064946 RepID=UPI002735F446|nr:four-carbon acid sugar kinase family protein [Methylobacterium sp. NEAU K]MDP4002754.1 four-carbon acid sugar kinase family protein [Methylobacterium sp. NEAU K]